MSSFCYLETLMVGDFKSVHSGNILKYTMYTLLLVSWLMIQLNLKEMPQLIVICVLFMMILLHHFQKQLLFRVANFILLSIWMFSFAFQLIDFIFDVLNPNRGWIEVKGEMYRVMDASGIIIVPVSLIIALIFAIFNWRANKNKSTRIEYHFAIVGILASGVVFIWGEVM